MILEGVPNAPLPIVTYFDGFIVNNKPTTFHSQVSGEGSAALLSLDLRDQPLVLLLSPP